MRGDTTIFDRAKATKPHHDAGCAVFPDVFVTSDPRDRAPEADLFKQHPGLVVEVVNEASGAYARGRKFEIYRSLPSLREVMFVEEDHIQVDLFRRNASGRWELFPANIEGVLRLESVDIDISIAQIYDGVLPRRENQVSGETAQT